MKTILIVEDDTDLRRMFRTALALVGYSTFEAADGIEALRTLDTLRPDAVILDLGLPFISGESVRYEIAAQAHTRDIPVIVVTGMAGDYSHLEVACLLRKPVTPERLVDTVQQCIASGGSALTKS